MAKSKKKFFTLYDVLRMDLNDKVAKEIKSVRYFAVNTAMKEMTRYIADVKRNNRTIRKERQEVMLKVLRVLYTYLHKNSNGQVCPSMRTIAFKINPSLEHPSITDKPQVAKAKERAIHATEMAVQRAIHTLEEIGVLKTFSYYINEEHYESQRHGCFFYILTPLSEYSSIYRAKPVFNEVKNQPTVECIHDKDPEEIIYSVADYPRLSFREERARKKAEREKQKQRKLEEEKRQQEFEREKQFSEQVESMLEKQRNDNKVEKFNFLEAIRRQAQKTSPVLVMA